MPALIRIDELIMQRHKYLEEEDVCFKIMDYPPYNKYGSTPINCLIMDFKISPQDISARRSLAKKAAIKKMAVIFEESVSPYFALDEITLIPTPPSKRKDHPAYDERLIELLNSYCAKNKKAQLKDTITSTRNLKSSHNSDDRETPEALLEHLILDETFSLDNKSIVIVDDVITHEAHFKACKQLILSRFNPFEITGLFIASTIN